MRCGSGTSGALSHARCALKDSTAAAACAHSAGSVAAVSVASTRGASMRAGTAPLRAVALGTPLGHALAAGRGASSADGASAVRWPTAPA
eukprot:354474-Chlamydomonas_euryale.AAC.5